MCSATAVIAVSQYWDSYAPDSISYVIRGVSLVLFIFFLIAPLLTTFIAVLGHRNSPSIAWLIGYAALLILTLQLNPIAQTYMMPFAQWHVDDLQKKAVSAELVGKSELAVKETLGSPTREKQLTGPGQVKQLRYRYWWPFWADAPELLVNIEDERVVDVSSR